MIKQRRTLAFTFTMILGVSLTSVVHAAEDSGSALFEKLAQCSGKLAAGELFESYVPGLKQLGRNSQAAIDYLATSRGYKRGLADEMAKASHDAYQNELSANPRRARGALSQLASECRAHLVEVETLHTSDQVALKQQIADAEEAKRQERLRAEAEAERLKAEADRVRAEAGKIRAASVEREETAKRNTIIAEAEAKAKVEVAKIEAVARAEQELARIESEAKVEQLKATAEVDRLEKTRAAEEAAASTVVASALDSDEFAESSSDSHSQQSTHIKSILENVVGSTFGVGSCENDRMIHFGEDYAANLVAGRVQSAGRISYAEEASVLRVRMEAVGMTTTYRYSNGSLVTENLEFGGINVKAAMRPLVKCGNVRLGKVDFDEKEATRDEALRHGAQMAILAKDFNALQSFSKAGVDFQDSVGGKSLVDWAAFSTAEIRAFVTNGDGAAADSFAQYTDDGQSWEPVEFLPSQYQRSFSGFCDFGTVTYSNHKTIDLVFGEPPKERSIRKVYRSGRFYRVEIDDGGIQILHVLEDGNLQIKASLFESGVPMPGKQGVVLTRCD